ncbi:Alginate lyase [Mucilaginibacter gossypiicola]|uniref:Alginate lyase n=1 Tax=Mucilaginibacter gossypiicola TaxID=551995 RepID=A0A1H8LNU0_9SPHI|nr:alginate lyase family protein [Mucilaginibacter gossypiicola]SEO06759.1 Alginate lyase [Mucilaginibacter gossypiicola]
MKPHLWLLALCAILVTMSCKKSPSLHGVEQNSKGVANPNGATVFVHPGILLTKESIDYIKTQLNSSSDPWSTSFTALQTTSWASISYKMQGPTPLVTRDPTIIAKDGIDYANIIQNDSYAIFCQGLMWKLTGNNKYADNAINMLNAWSSTLKSITSTGPDVYLCAGFNGFIMANGAELVRDYSGWKAEDLQKCKDMFRNIWYPVIKSIAIPGGANGTWDSDNAKAVMAMGIFLDDQGMFDAAYNYFYNGSGDGTVAHYFLPTGQNQESGRKQGYAQLGLCNFEELCEMGYNQGKPDMWVAKDTIIKKAFEYAAKYNLGEDVPYNTAFPEVYGQWVYPSISTDGRGVFRPIYYMAYNHFHNRLGSDMPYTQRVLEQHTPIERQTDGTVTDGTGWGSLLFYHPSAGGLTPVAVGALRWEFDELAGWGGIPWAENSKVAVANGQLEVSGSIGTYVRAWQGSALLDPVTYPYLALKVTQIPKLKKSTDDWAVQAYWSVGGSNHDYRYVSKTDMTLLGTQVYVIKWAPKGGLNDGLPFPAASTTGGLYLDFGDCASGEKAKVDWVRSYKTLADIPNN